MTTKVKAQKFRVRRAPRAATPAVQGGETPIVDATGQAPSKEAATKAFDDDKLFDNDASADGFGDAPFAGSAAAQAAAQKTPQKTPGTETQNAAPSATGRGGRIKGGVARALGQTTDTNTALTGDVTPADEASIDAEIDAIRREGLTGRQLRMARRVAQKHGIAATSDFDAVRQLRKQGIDPFQRAAILDLVTTEGKPPSRELTTTEGPKLPKTIDNAPKLPSKDILERLTREDEISTIQRDIARRRRRKMVLLIARLAVFVGIPTILAGIYFYTIATPMYATQSAFLIQQADSAGGAGGLGGLMGASGLGGAQDSIAVQEFLESRDAMLRLDADAGFKAHFSSDAIDPIQRLPQNPTNEQAYKVYQDRVSIGYDPTEGLLKMEVVAATPQTSQLFSDMLVEYAEESVDHLTQRMREDQMKGARESLDDAEAKMKAAQEKVVLLQEQLGIISPDAETAAIMGQVSGFETQLQEKKLQLQQLLDNPRPNQARVDGTRGDIGRLETLIAELRSQLTQATGASGSLARISAELRMAEVDLATRQTMAQQAIQSLEMARIEANRQVRYLSLSSRPIAPDEPTYPRKFESTLLSMLLFSGIYLMASLTAAVLREQVSA
ncbi:capsule polysaccharide export [Celeribacter baekdonensis]|uniref:Capsule polysaccharide export n=1 Tax=Celeribacter baekdonensis B30 TaxID=1208323 RepID=K2JS97_9RHOB|nr:capsule polysaccharide export [Celeribacter baekdonensis]EKE68020.1 capsule polysaccharide export [Celeribacter baekdonensis B30]